MVAVLLMVPVKHEVFLFASNHTHILYAASGLSLKTYTAQPGLQVMSGPALNYTHTHTQICILDLYGVLHPPLTAQLFFFIVFYHCHDEVFNVCHETRLQFKFK